MLQEFADNGGNNTRRSQTAKLALIIWVGVTNRFFRIPEHVRQVIILNWRRSFGLTSFLTLGPLLLPDGVKPLRQR
jgi:hypothetical protein